MYACCSDNCTRTDFIIIVEYLRDITLAMRMAEKPLPLLGSMDVFNPDVDDWSTYVERLESFFVANDVKDKKKVTALITVIGTKAYSLLRYIITPAKVIDKTT